MKHCPPCAGACNQGRDCPAPAEPPIWDLTPFELLCGVIVIVLTIVASAWADGRFLP